jgi:hypothetical protein
MCGERIPDVIRRYRKLAPSIRFFRDFECNGDFATVCAECRSRNSPEGRVGAISKYIQGQPALRSFRASILEIYHEDDGTQFAEKLEARTILAVGDACAIGYRVQPLGRKR